MCLGGMPGDENSVGVALKLSIMGADAQDWVAHFVDDFVDLGLGS